jgi:hypothetical protein
VGDEQKAVAMESARTSIARLAVQWARAA